MNYTSTNPETQKSPESLTYMKWINHSNRELKLASTAMTIVFVNHVLSALDATWSVNQYNKSIGTSVRTNYVMLDSEPNLALSLNGIDVK